MNAEVGGARIGQWYTRGDKGQPFQVTGLDSRAKTIEIQTFDGDVDEIETEDWASLPLGLAEPPEDWTGPMDDSEANESGHTGISTQDWKTPLDSLNIEQPSAQFWAETEDPGDSDSERPRAASSVCGSWSRE